MAKKKMNRNVLIGGGLAAAGILGGAIWWLTRKAKIDLVPSAARVFNAFVPSGSGWKANSNSFIEFDFQLPEAGSYALLIAAHNFTPLPSGSGYSFNCELTVNGARQGNILIPGSDSGATVAKQVSLRAGKNTVGLNWVNNDFVTVDGKQYDANLMISSVRVVSVDQVPSGSLQGLGAVGREVSSEMIPIS